MMIHAFTFVSLNKIGLSHQSERKEEVGNLRVSIDTVPESLDTLNRQVT